MGAPALPRHWLVAIRIADDALTAAARVDALSTQEASRGLRVLASERAWLRAFPWARGWVRSSPNGVSALSRTADRSRRGLMRGASPNTATGGRHAQDFHHRNRCPGPGRSCDRRELAARRRDARPWLPLVPGRRQVHEGGCPPRNRHADQP